MSVMSDSVAPSGAAVPFMIRAPVVCTTRLISHAPSEPCLGNFERKKFEIVLALGFFCATLLSRE